MMKKYLLAAFLFTTFISFAQVNYRVKLMSWNILNFPETSSSAATAADTTARCPAYRSVVQLVNPDILVTMENTGSLTPPIILSQVMNTGLYHYEAGTFINGYDSDNSIYYRDSVFDFVSNQPIQTALRDISHFTLVMKATGDTLHIFAVHLKASQGYESNRAAEVAKLRQVTNAFPTGTNFIVAGDFNIYESGEPAYTALLQDNPNDDGNFNDIYTMPGIWNQSAYAPYHTQSTHYSGLGGFSGGGLDDRFDMILFSKAVQQPGGVYYLPGTYKSIGNDSNHYGDAINYGTNTAVPAGVDDALFNASDHLPVTIDMEIGPTSGIEEIAKNVSDVEVFPNPVEANSRIYFTVAKPTNVQFSITDLMGRTISEGLSTAFYTGRNELPLDVSGLKEGVFFLLLKFDNILISKKIILMR